MVSARSMAAAPFRVRAVMVSSVVRFMERVASAKSSGKTGVEMEALLAATVAAVTVYDMCKAVDRGMVIENICLQSKKGGKSGTYKRSENG